MLSETAGVDNTHDEMPLFWQTRYAIHLMKNMNDCFRRLTALALWKRGESSTQGFTCEGIVKFIFWINIVDKWSVWKEVDVTFFMSAKNKILGISSELLPCCDARCTTKLSFMTPGLTTSTGQYTHLSTSMIVWQVSVSLAGVRCGPVWGQLFERKKSLRKNYQRRKPVIIFAQRETRHSSYSSFEKLRSASYTVFNRENCVSKNVLTRMFILGWWLENCRSILSQPMSFLCGTLK